MEQTIADIKIKSSKMIKILAGCIIILNICNMLVLFFKYYLGHVNVFGFIRQFNLDLEANIPTYFSSLLLLISSCLLYSIAAALKSRGDKYTTHWFCMAIIFLFLSIDEVSSLHEMLIAPLNRGYDLSGFLYFSWVIVGFVAVIVMAIFYLRFLLALPNNTKINFIIAAGVYLGGALGIEMVGGYYSSNYDTPSFVYQLITTLEETMEMVGLLIFINALIDFLHYNKLGIQFSFSRK